MSLSDQQISVKPEKVLSVTKNSWNNWLADPTKGYRAVNDADNLDQHYREGYWDFSYHILNPVIKYVNPQSTALEIGCGFGRLTVAAGRFFSSVSALDISKVAVENCREYVDSMGLNNIFVRESDGKTIPFDDQFDLVYSFLVFQHIPSQDVVRSYVSEIHRVLKPGGIARIQLRKSTSSFHSKDYDEVNEDWTMNQGCSWTGRQAKKMFSEAGFKVLSISDGSRRAWETELSNRQLWITAKNQ